MTNDAQGESTYVVQFATSIDDKILLEKGEGNVKVDPLPTSNDRPDEAHRQSEYGDHKNLEGVVCQNPFLQSSESLEYEGDGLNDTVTEENKFHFNTSQLSENSDVFSTDVDAVVSSMKTELVNSEPIPEEMHAKEHTEVSPVKLTVESLQRSDEIEASVNSMKTGTNENHIVHLPESSLMASSNERQRDEHFGSAISEACSVINTECKNHHEINDVTLDGKVVRANIENHIEIKLKDHQPGDILLSDDLFKSEYDGKSDAAGEMGKNEQCDVPDAQCKEIPTVSDTSLPKSSTSDFDTPVISESSEMVADGPANHSNGTECRKINSLSGTQKDIKEDEININVKLNEEYNELVDTSAHSQQAQGSELLVKAAEDLARKYTFPLTIEASAQHDTAVEDHFGGDPGREVSGFTAVPVQDQTGNTLVKLGSSGVDASVDSGSQCDSLEGNWGSVSVRSMQSDAPAGIDSETLPSTGVPSIEAGKSNINNPRAALARQQSGKSEMFEPPSFMTLVEPRQVSPKVAASEGQKEQNPQQADPTSQAAWFPTLTQVVNDSQGRKKNEEIIAKVTNWSTTKEHTPLKSLLGEAAHDNKPKSPKMEESLVNQMSSKVSEKNGSGLTTVNSILGPESPSAQVVKGEAAQEWNSPARYPADIKREKRKVKSRPYWIQLVCCTSVGPQRR
ncbi:hypothetical protein Fmac_004775 [Flemingia macrophylla]|uniref:Uncharacterized protein n=1 Tax=Flemingia macrophylla TaxID=520843 RepID=A0ABD1N8J4_9FABA